MTFCGLDGGELGMGRHELWLLKKWMKVGCRMSPLLFSCTLPLLIISRFFGSFPCPFIPLHSTSPFVDPSFLMSFFLLTFSSSIHPFHTKHNQEKKSLDLNRVISQVNDKLTFRNLASYVWDGRKITL